MSLEKYTKQELISIIEEVSFLLEKIKYPTKKNRGHKDDLEELIGSLPFLLLNESIFEKNLDIARFAEKLGIKIPSPEKKKKEDIIGRVIASVAKFNSNKITELNLIIGELNQTQKSSNKNNFFTDWEDAIKNINL